MHRKIALEEHFALPDSSMNLGQRLGAGGFPAKLRSNLLDIHEKRLAEMEKNGIDLMVLSMNGPGIQAILDPKQANEAARLANDFLAEQVNKNPQRFQALAALPLQDPELAAQELTRCAKDLGFRGALVNGFSQIGAEDSVAYYDLPQYWPFWKVVEELDVPFYLHPREPILSREPIYEGHPWLSGAPWGFGVETATHALRIMGSGLFDHFPKVTIILGHLGEGLPGSMWRLDNRILHSPKGIRAQKPLSEYFRNNFYLTTSGNLRMQTLIDSIMAVGIDRVMFSVDYPFEELGSAAEWFENTDITEMDRIKIGSANAERLLKLSKRTFST